MEKIILYVDDAVYACEQFAELAPDADTVVARHWVLVACAPRMTHRISKWVSHSAVSYTHLTLPTKRIV